MVRVLVTVEPRMYREAIAGALRRSRPHSEVLLAPEVSLNGQVHEFAPHVLVRSDFGQQIPEELMGGVVHLDSTPGVGRFNSRSLLASSPRKSCVWGISR